MNKLRIIMLILILLATTILVYISNPKIHKEVVIGNAKVVLVQNQKTIKTVQENISNKIKTDNFKKEAKNTTASSPIQKEIEKSVATPRLPQNVKSETSVKTSPQPSEKKRQLTAEEEEIIAWNQWRSDLQNKVMRDTKLQAPIGTVFRFSFTVDREGTISNLKTWSDDSQYTDQAVRIVKPKLLSYQGQSILNFPPKSKRIITNVNGEFVVWYKSGYSSPSDYSDYERVKK